MTVRLAELVAGLSVASDLGKGLTDGQGLRSTILAMHLADEIALSEADREALYWVGLLRFVGCTATASEMAEGLGDEIAVSAAFAAADTKDIRDALRRVIGLVGKRPDKVASFVAKVPSIISAHETASCEVAQVIAAQLGLPESVSNALAAVFERYDGKGTPGRRSGDRIPLATRVWQLAHTIDVLSETESAGEVAKQLIHRAGTALDPHLARGVAARLEWLEGPRPVAMIAAVLDVEPTPHRTVEDADLDSVLAVFGEIADLKSPYFRGHCQRVSELAARAAAAAGFSGSDISRVRRAGLVQDVGRVAVSSRIWNQERPLSEGERVHVESHSYFTQRILGRIPALSDLADLACCHHERSDGSGYHRQLSGSSLSPLAALLAAAETYVTWGEERPHRVPLTTADRHRQLREVARSGGLPEDAVDAVLAAADETPLPPRPKAGLTDREREVLEVVAQGLTNAAAARRLGISPKTVNTHLEHVYAKLAVSTRASAVVAATQRGWISV